MTKQHTECDYDENVLLIIVADEGGEFNMSEYIWTLVLNIIKLSSRKQSLWIIWGKLIKWRPWKPTEKPTSQQELHLLRKNIRSPIHYLSSLLMHAWIYSSILIQNEALLQNSHFGFILQQANCPSAINPITLSRRSKIRRFNISQRWICCRRLVERFLWAWTQTQASLIQSTRGCSQLLMCLLKQTNVSSEPHPNGDLCDAVGCHGDTGAHPLVVHHVAPPQVHH